MVAIKGYDFKDKIFDGDHSIIYRALRNQDKKSVIIKILKEEFPNLEEIARFKREFEIGKLAQQEGVVKELSIEKEGHTYAIIMEDIGGISLDQVLLQKPLPLNEFLEFAIHITDILGRIHERSIIHKDINPSNIVWNSKSNVLEIIDFGVSATLAHEKFGMITPNLLEGTLEYISPEQTGRMNRGIDYRTDYYSLGVMFYQMLSGKLPFESKDPMELIHYHMAKPPLPLNELNPLIPEIISKIVLKLMAKTVEERYQSPSGLKYDLEHCLQELNRSGKILPFPLATHDLSTHLQIPEKLYGRESEIEKLLKTFDEVCHGQVKLLLVAGYSGIGKTSLVNEVHKPMVEKRGYFVSGKFDQFKQNIPYAAIVQALEEWIRQILMEGPTSVAAWKKSLSAAVGSNGGVVIEIIPAFEQILGPQAKPAGLGPTESQDRLTLVFEKLIQNIATSTHPLIMFLDDLQRVDAASMHMIQQLLLHYNTKYLLILGAYRDNEVNEAHVLKISLDTLEKEGFHYDLLRLAPLDFPNVSQLIADTLQTSLEQVESLAKLCYSRTGGNPFFLNQLLRYLYEKKLLYLDTAHNQWNWDITKIKSEGITDNIADLMLNKLKQLKTETLEVLKIASCIAHRFDLQTLADIHGRTAEETLDDLWEALETELILPEDETYKYLKVGGVFSNTRFHFLHDRVEQAAYAMIPEPKKIEIHHRIGQQLLSNTPKEKVEENIFHIVNQMNLGEALIVEKSEIDQLIQLNFKAGNQAKKAAAFKPAVSYFQFAKRKIGIDCWEKKYELTLNISKPLAECLYNIAQYEEANRLIEEMLSHVKTNLEQADIYSMQVFQLTSLGRLGEALECGMRGLKVLKIGIALRPSKISILLQLALVRWNLGRRSIASLVNEPMLDSPYLVQLIRLLNSMRLSAFFMGYTSLVAMLTLKATNLSLRHGNSPEAAYAYSGFGVILHCYFEDLKHGSEFLKLSVALNEKLDDLPSQAIIYMTYVALSFPWEHHFKMLQSALNQAIEIGLKTGDLLSVAQCCQYAVMWDPEMPQDLVYQESEKYAKIIDQARFQISWDLFKIGQLYHANLAGKTLDRFSLSDATHNEYQALERLKKNHHNLGISVYYLRKAAIAYTYGQYSQALSLIREGEGSASAIYGMLSYTDFCFFSFLIYIANYSKASWKDKIRFRIILRKYLGKMTKWAAYCPVNFIHKKVLMEAELARIQKKTKKAGVLYEQATLLAQKHEFLNIEALANELAAQFYLEQHQHTIARSLMLEAYYAYFRYGAKAKLQSLEETYPDILSQKAIRSIVPTSSIAAPHTTSTTFSTERKSIYLGSTTSTRSEPFDIHSVVKASQVISGEIVLDKLLNTMMHIVIENMGAEKGWLILEKEGKWSVVAEGTVDKVNLISSPIESLPVSLIHSVIYSKKPVSYSNPARLSEFTSDAYMQRVQPKSVVCIPLLNHGELKGLLYLENNLTTDAFNPNRMEVMNLLSSQMAISVDNARFYSDMAALNKHLSDLNLSLTRFVPQEFLGLLGKKSILEVTIGDSSRKEMTVLFSDIRNFTTLSEKMTPQENFKFLNDLLKIMVPIIQKWQGFVDKYLGDGIMALFPAEADHALRAAIGMQKALATFNAEYYPNPADAIRVGVGINSGPLILGTVGDEHRLDGTVISDVVNIASRVQDVTKVYGCPILITQETYNRLRDPSEYQIRKVDKVLLRGKSIPIIVYEVFDADLPEVIELKKQFLADFETALSLYNENKLSEALALFDKIVQNNQKDVVAASWRSIISKKMEKLQ